MRRLSTSRDSPYCRKFLFKPFVFCEGMVMYKPAVPRNYVEYDLAALKLEAEVEFAQPRAAHGFTQPRLAVLTIEHQETASAGAGNFPSNGPVLFCQFIPGVNLRVAHSVR